MSQRILVRLVPGFVNSLQNIQICAIHFADTYLLFVVLAWHNAINDVSSSVLIIPL